MNQLFIISSDAWLAATYGEIDSICSDLKELGLYSLPYPEVDIGVSADIAVKWIDPDGKPSTNAASGLVDGKAVPPLGPEYLLIYHGVTASGSFRSCEITGPYGAVSATPHGAIADTLCRMLISLLATRNVRKTTTINKLARFGIGTGSKKNRSSLRRYSYVTTISTPHELAADLEHPPTGIKRCPHLRRGHIRHRQHYGPNRQFVKSVWIEPIFVNASEEFTKTRTAYNLLVPTEGAKPPVLEPTESNS